jgi:hypothetical protein
MKALVNLDVADFASSALSRLEPLQRKQKAGAPFSDAPAF